MTGRTAPDTKEAPPPVGMVRPAPVAMTGFVVEATPCAGCDEVPPGGVRVVRAEAPAASPTTILIGWLQGWARPCRAPAGLGPTWGSR